MLPAEYRLKGQKNFSRVFRGGKTLSNEVLLMKISAGERDKPSQFGFGAGVKFSKRAAERNKIKRWIREAARGYIKRVGPGHRAIFFINPKASKDKVDLELIQEKMGDLLNKAELL